MKKTLVTIFSDASNTDLDYTKILGGIAFAVFLVLSFYAYGYKGSNWNPLEWTTAASVLIGAISGVSKIKDYTTKPKIDEPTIT